MVSAGCDVYSAYECSGGSARVWSAVTGREIGRITYGDEVRIAAFTPDGQWVISASGNILKSWRLSNGGHEITHQTHTESAIKAVAFSPDGRWVIFGCVDGTAQVREIWTERAVARIEQVEQVSEWNFSADGRWAASSGFGGPVRVWEIATGREVMHFARDGQKLLFSPDGRWIAIMNSGAVRVWQVETGREVAKITHQNYVRTVAFSPDGRWIISGSDDGTARVFDTVATHEVLHITHANSIEAQAFSADGRWVVTAGCDKLDGFRCLSSSARVWKTTTGLETARITYDEAIKAVGLSPDGRLLVSGTASTINVWEVLTERKVLEVTNPFANSLQTVAISPDWRWMVIVNSQTVNVWDLTASITAASAVEVAQFPRGYRVYAVTFSPDGHQFLIGGCDDLDSQHMCADGSVRVWETATGREITSVQHESYVNTAAFSPDGRWVISGSDDRTARVWESDTGHEIARVVHEAYVKAVAFSPDGRWIASGSDDGVVRVWEARTGRIVAEMAHGTGVGVVAFSPDGRLVASAACDIDDVYGGPFCYAGSVRVWWWQPEDMIDLACGRLTRNLTREEWRQYLGDEPYRATCPNLPEAPAGNE